MQRPAGPLDDVRDRLLRPLSDRRSPLSPPVHGAHGRHQRARLPALGAALRRRPRLHRDDRGQGILHDNRRTLAYLACGPDEHPIGFQLFAAEPAALARAARACAAAGADLIDLNMACPVRKVMKTGAGAALLARRSGPSIAGIAKAVVAEVAGAVRVTVKLRSGVGAGDQAGRLLAPRLVRRRSPRSACTAPASQLYRGTADHDLTLALAGELPAPLIASGDIAVVGSDERPDRELTARLLEGGVVAAESWWRAPPWGGSLGVRRAARGRGRAAARGAAARPRPLVDEAAGDLGPRTVGYYLRRFWPRFRRSGRSMRGDVAAHGGPRPCDYPESRTGRLKREPCPRRARWHGNGKDL